VDHEAITGRRERLGDGSDREHDSDLTYVKVD
jgi:hypothetical protein